MTTEEFMRSIRDELATTASMSAAYSKSWGDQYIRESIVRVWKDEEYGMRSKTGRRITPNEILALTDDDLREAGFGLWDDEGIERLWLVPLYLFNYLCYSTELRSISGEVKRVGRDEIDLDVRFGCIAYGIARL
jgi:hypothetical protein